VGTSDDQAGRPHNTGRSSPRSGDNLFDLILGAHVDDFIRRKGGFAPLVLARRKRFGSLMRNGI
jgi:hypothetical protein